MYSGRKILESRLNILVRDIFFYVKTHVEGSWYTGFRSDLISVLVSRIDSQTFIVNKDIFLERTKHAKVYFKDDIILIKGNKVISLNRPKRILPLISNKKLLIKLKHKLLKALTEKLKIDNINLQFDRLHYDSDYYSLALYVIGEGVPVRTTLGVIRTTVEKFIANYHKKTGDHISIGDLHNEVCDSIVVKIFESDPNSDPTPSSTTSIEFNIEILNP